MHRSFLAKPLPRCRGLIGNAKSACRKLRERSRIDHSNGKLGDSNGPQPKGNLDCLERSEISVKRASRFLISACRDIVGPPAAQISLHCDLTSSRNVTGQPRFRHRRSTESYSRRSVSAGSIRAARRAGRATASNAGPISTNAELSKTDSDVECAP